MRPDRGSLVGAGVNPGERFGECWLAAVETPPEESQRLQDEEVARRDQGMQRELELGESGNA